MKNTLTFKTLICVIFSAFSLLSLNTVQAKSSDDPKTFFKYSPLTCYTLRDLSTGKVGSSSYIAHSPEHLKKIRLEAKRKKAKGDRTSVVFEKQHPCSNSDIAGVIDADKRFYNGRCSSTNNLPDNMKSYCIYLRKRTIALQTAFERKLAAGGYTPPSQTASSSGKNTGNSQEYNSNARKGEGSVNLCLMPSSSGGSPMWTIALGANRNQALQNRRLIMPEGCRQQVTCDGGWYAVVMNKGRGTSMGFSCGNKSRQAAINDARNRCLSKNRNNSGCTSCISGKTTGENKVAQTGTVWMGNRFSKYCN